MDKQSKNLQNLKEGADQAFQEIFTNPFKKKEEGSEALYHDDVIVITPDHKIHFTKTKSTIVNPLPNYGVWTKLDWSSNDLAWMAKSAFKADAVQMDGKGSSRKVVAVKNCLFESGNFRGGKFLRGKFAGDSFVGQFGPGAEWLTTPFAFVEGTTRETETILGQKNMSVFNQNKFNFNIIRVTPGSKIIIQMQDGTVHEVTVLKRLDEKSSKFQFQVKNGESNKVFKLIVSWAYLRGNSKEEFENNTVFSNSQIPGLFSDKFQLGFKSPVVKVVVTEDVSYEEEIVEPEQEKALSSEELAAHQESFDLANIPLFGIKDIPGQPITIKGKRGQYKNNVGRVFFNFRNNDQMKGYQDTVKNLESRVLRADLTELKSKLQNEIIDGAPAQYPYLAALIGPISEDKEKVELDQNFIGSLSRIETMLKDFVDTMVLRVKKKEGIYDVSNDKVKDMVKDSVKSFLGIGETPEAAAEVEPEVGSALKGKGPAALQENVRKAVRKIIFDNLEHF